MRTALILLFLLALAAIPGSLIPQTRVDASAVAAFKDRHPDLAPVFDRIGMFNVYSSVWFSAIYVLLMVSLIGCFIPRLRVYLAAVRARPPKAPRNLSRFAAYDTWTSDEPVEVEAERDPRPAASSSGVESTSYDGDGEVTVSAEKGYLREAGNLLFHLSLLVVLVGVAVTGLYGFKGNVLGGRRARASPTRLTQYDEFTPGARFDVADLAPFSFNVDDFHVDVGAGGCRHRYAADVRRRPHGHRPARRRAVSRTTCGSTTRSRSTARRSSSSATGMRRSSRCEDGDGNVAFSGPVIFLPQDSSFVSYGVIKAPDAQPQQLAFEGYFFPTASLCDGAPCSTVPRRRQPDAVAARLHTATSALDDGAAAVGLRARQGQPRAGQDAGRQPAGAAADRGQDRRASATARARSRSTATSAGSGCRSATSPGKVVPLVGVLAAIVGLLGSLFIRPRRTWARVREVDGRTVVEIAALDRVSGGDPEAHVDERRDGAASSERPSGLAEEQK